MNIKETQYKKEIPSCRNLSFAARENGGRRIFLRRKPLERGNRRSRHPRRNTFAVPRPYSISTQFPGAFSALSPAPRTTARTA